MAEHGDLWGFCQEVYDQPGVEELCLHLQDHHQMSVSLLLWCAWLEMEQRPLSDNQLRMAQERAREIEDSLLIQLRQVRRAVKEREFFPAVVEKDLRQHILMAELCMERQLLTELEALSARPQKKPPVPQPLECLTAGWHLPQVEQWLREIRAAAARVHGGGC